MSGNQGSTHWDDHDLHDEGQSSGGVNPLDPPDDVLHASFEEVELEPAQKKAGRGGVNPRLLAVLMMVVVLGAAGYAFMKMKSRAAAVDEPLSSTVASTDPVQQTPGATGSIGMPMGNGGQGHDLLGGGASASSPVQPPPTFVPDPVPATAQKTEAPAFQPAPQAPQMPTAPTVASAPPPGGDASQLNAMVAQLQSMQTDTTRLMSENAQLRSQLKTAEEKLKEQRAPQRSTAEKQVPKHAVAKSARSAAPSSPPKRGGRVPDEQILTESRESRFAAMSVRAIYPLNGRNARAWVNVGNDLVEVSAGSTINGAMVKSISPEAMEVVTDAGVIRAQR